MDPTDEAKTTRIRQLNDQLRTRFTGGRVVITSGVRALGVNAVAEILTEVSEYEDFTEDVYGEHDFGAFTFDGQKFFWKVDYYDLDMKFLSPDTSDPAVTNRVLTILLASEY